MLKVGGATGARARPRTSITNFVLRTVYGVYGARFAYAYWDFFPPLHVDSGLENESGWMDVNTRLLPEGFAWATHSSRTCMTDHRARPQELASTVLYMYADRPDSAKYYQLEESETASIPVQLSQVWQFIAHSRGRAAFFAALAWRPKPNQRRERKKKKHPVAHLESTIYTGWPQTGNDLGFVCEEASRWRRLWETLCVSDR
jgi:hypothetical protein